IQNYIVGMSDNGLLDGSDVYRFRVYQNASAAVLTGFEVSGVAEVLTGLSIAGSAAYTRGQNREIDEPMYLIPPFSGMLSLRWDQASYWAEIESRMAMPQNRVARIVAEEDGTDGYVVLNVRGSKVFNDRIAVKVGVENIFDTLYHQHLSFGNLPSEGRNLYTSVSYSL
ncbi:MAG: TonB-dependent receptor, partial [Bacteroidetes Order II. Incertae sedis bacterium]|nr:TonB-dependent receptor [Bacteroidetes Order II. bacterium]